MLDEIIELFSTMSPILTAMLIVGLLTVIIQIILPGNGVLGFIGGFLLVFVIIATFIAESLQHFIMVVAISFVLVLLVSLIVIRSVKFGILGNSPLYTKKTTLPEDFSENFDYDFLLGKIGKTITDCKPIGKIVVDKKIYQAISDGKYLSKGRDIKVVEVDGDTILVKQI